MKLTKQQAYNDYKEIILHSYESMRAYKKSFPDCDLRYDWQIFVDQLNKDGLITDNQVNNWSNPF
tara:strand:- start:332 stop:526 length:195 start_codon:yes stop_codon:yes gene_type:complete